jgi:hypothetical protein
VILVRACWVFVWIWLVLSLRLTDCDGDGGAGGKVGGRWRIVAVSKLKI